MAIVRGDRQNHTRSLCRPVTHSLSKMCFVSPRCVLSLLIYRGREPGDIGTGSGRVRYGKREVLTPLSPTSQNGQYGKALKLEKMCLHFQVWML